MLSESIRFNSNSSLNPAAHEKDLIKNLDEIYGKMIEIKNLQIKWLFNEDKKFDKHFSDAIKDLNKKFKKILTKESAKTPKNGTSFEDITKKVCAACLRPISEELAPKQFDILSEWYQLSQSPLVATIIKEWSLKQSQCIDLENIPRHLNFSLLQKTDVISQLMKISLVQFELLLKQLPEPWQKECVKVCSQGRFEIVQKLQTQAIRYSLQKELEYFLFDSCIDYSKHSEVLKTLIERNAGFKKTLNTHLPDLFLAHGIKIDDLFLSESNFRAAVRFIRQKMLLSSFHPWSCDILPSFDVNTLKNLGLEIKEDLLQDGTFFQTDIGLEIYFTLFAHDLTAGLKLVHTILQNPLPECPYYTNLIHLWVNEIIQHPEFNFYVKLKTRVETLNAIIKPIEFYSLKLLPKHKINPFWTKDEILLLNNKIEIKNAAVKSLLQQLHQFFKPFLASDNLNVDKTQLHLTYPGFKFQQHLKFEIIKLHRFFRLEEKTFYRWSVVDYKIKLDKAKSLQDLDKKDLRHIFTLLHLAALYIENEEKNQIPDSYLELASILQGIKNHPAAKKGLQDPEIQGLCALLDIHIKAHYDLHSDAPPVKLSFDELFQSILDGNAKYAFFIIAMHRNIKQTKDIFNALIALSTNETRNGNLLRFCIYYLQEKMSVPLPSAPEFKNLEQTLNKILQRPYPTTPVFEDLKQQLKIEMTLIFGLPEIVNTPSIKDTFKLLSSTLKKISEVDSIYSDSFNEIKASLIELKNLYCTDWINHPIAKTSVFKAVFEEIEVLLHSNLSPLDFIQIKNRLKNYLKILFETPQASSDPLCIPQEDLIVPTKFNFSDPLSTKVLNDFDLIKHYINLSEKIVDQGPIEIETAKRRGATPKFNFSDPLLTKVLNDFDLIKHYINLSEKIVDQGPIEIETAKRRGATPDIVEKLDQEIRIHQEKIKELQLVLKRYKVYLNECKKLTICYRFEKLINIENIIGLLEINYKHFNEKKDSESIKRAKKIQEISLNLESFKNTPGKDLKDALKAIKKLTSDDLEYRDYQAITGSNNKFKEVPIDLSQIETDLIEYATYSKSHLTKHHLAELDDLSEDECYHQLTECFTGSHAHLWPSEYDEALFGKREGVHQSIHVLQNTWLVNAIAQYFIPYTLVISSSGGSLLNKWTRVMEIAIQKRNYALAAAIMQGLQVYEKFMADKDFLTSYTKSKNLFNMKTQEYKEAIIGTHDDFSPCYPYQLKITQPMEQLIEKWNMTDADDFNLDGIVDMVHLKVMVTRYTNSHQSVTTSLKSTSSSNYLRLFLYNLSDNLYYLKRIVERGYRNAKHETDAALFLKVGMGKL